MPPRFCASRVHTRFCLFLWRFRDDIFTVGKFNSSLGALTGLSKETKKHGFSSGPQTYRCHGCCSLAISGLVLLIAVLRHSHAHVTASSGVDLGCSVSVCGFATVVAQVDEQELASPWRSQFQRTWKTRRWYFRRTSSGMWLSW